MPSSPPLTAPRSAPPVPSRAIGRSEEGRAIRAFFPRSRAAPSALRVLIVAGQHGDEPLARQAVEGLLDGELRKTGLLLAVVANANPDGAASKRRTNARGVDLNRDHQDLRASESLAVHRFAREWRPDFVIDVHTFPPRRKAMIARGVTYLQDVQFDVANHPALPEATRAYGERLLEHLLNLFSTTRFQASRYTLFRSDGRVRHSTPDLVDARNGLALRLGTPSLLIEGRQPTRRDSIDQSADTVAAIQRGLHATLAWIDQQPRFLESQRCLRSETTDRVHVRSRLIPGGDERFMLLADATTGRPKRYRLPASYTPEVKPTKPIELPSAYAIPKRHSLLLARLERHGFLTTKTYGPRPVERFERRPSGDSSEGGSDRTKRSTARWRRTLAADFDLSGYAVFSTSQYGGSSLAAHLEPRAKYSIGRGLSPADFDEVLRVH